jgi:tetratricopeptide (TPR) repeat protein
LQQQGGLIPGGGRGDEEGRPAAGSCRGQGLADQGQTGFVVPFQPHNSAGQGHLNDDGLEDLLGGRLGRALKPERTQVREHLHDVRAVNGPLQAREGVQGAIVGEEGQAGRLAADRLANSVYPPRVHDPAVLPVAADEQVGGRRRDLPAQEEVVGGRGGEGLQLGGLVGDVGSDQGGRPAEHLAVGQLAPGLAEGVQQVVGEGAGLPAVGETLLSRIGVPAGGQQYRVARRLVGWFDCLFDALLQLPEGDHTPTLQRVLLRMVNQDGLVVARRQIPLPELTPEPATPAGLEEAGRIERALRALDEARLIVFDTRPAEGGKTEEVVEPIHDVAVRRWPRMTDDWLKVVQARADNNEGLSIPQRQRLTEDAARWRAAPTGDRDKHTWADSPAPDQAVLLARGLFRHAVALRRGNPRGALLLIESALPTVQALASPGLRARAQLQIGITLARLDEFDRALAAFDSLPLAAGDAEEADDLAASRVGASLEKARVLERTERPGEAADCLQGALLGWLELAEQGSPAVALRGLADEAWRFSVLMDRMGRLKAATPIIDRTVAVLRRQAQTRDQLAEVLRFRGSMYDCLRHGAEALADYSEARSSPS